MANNSSSDKRAREILLCLQAKPHSLEELLEALKNKHLDRCNERNLRRDLQRLKEGKADGTAHSIVFRNGQYHLASHVASPQAAAFQYLLNAQKHLVIATPHWAAMEHIGTRMQTISSAIDKQRVIQFQYTRVHDIGAMEYEAKIVCPLKMKLWRDRIYLFAVPFDSALTPAIRVYVLDQIASKIELTRKPFNHAALLKKTDLERRLNEVIGVYLPETFVPPKPVEIHCKGWAYTDIKRRSIHGSQQLTEVKKDGWARLTLTVHRTPELEQFVAQYRDCAKFG